MPGRIRHEFVVAGCILAVVGFVAAAIGFDRIQETPLESAVRIVANISGSPAPPGLHPSKTGAYLMLCGGILSLGAGITLILNSRASGAGDPAADPPARSAKR